MGQPAGGVTKYGSQPAVTHGLWGRYRDAGTEALENLLFNSLTKKLYHVWRAEARICFVVEPYAFSQNRQVPGKSMKGLAKK